MSEVKLSRDELFLLPSMYLFYKHHPVLAVRDILGLQLAPHQRLDLRLQWSTRASDIIRIFSRGMSKTFGEALYAILASIFYAKIRVLSIGAGGFRQGKMILEEAERIIKGDLDGQKRTEFALKMVDISGRRTSSSVIRKDPDMWKIPWLNGAQIATAPLGTTGDAIRGYRANITQIDERKDLKQEIKERVLKPYGIIDYNIVTQKGEFENRNIDSGTLQYEEDDYTKELREFLRLIEQGSEDYLVIKFIYPDAFDEAKEDEEYKYYSTYFSKRLKFWKTPYGIKVDDIERNLDKLTTDIESWRAEYLCEAMRSAGDYYPFELINSAINKEIINDVKYMEMNDPEATQFLRPKKTCNDPCVLGVDCAREHAMTSFSVIRVGQIAEGEWDPVTQEGSTNFANVIWAYEEKHMHDQDAAILIYKILDWFPNIVVVALDKRGGGSGVSDQLYHTVKDGKIVDGRGKSVEVEILYDPDDDDDGGIATLLKGKRNERLSVNDRLRLVTYQDMDNTFVNRSMRNAIGDGMFYFGGGDEPLDDPDLKEIREYINVIPRQFRMIQTKPTKNWVSFTTPNPERDMKDLYSATIYGWGEVMKLIHDKHIKPKSRAVNIAPTMNLKFRRQR